MGLFFNEKQKNVRTRTCDCCSKSVESPTATYLLTPAQVVKSRKYWDYLMTSPEMYELSKRHFVNKDANATKQRGMIVVPLIQNSSPWCICEKCIDKFDVDKSIAKKYSIQKEENINFIPPNCGSAESVLPKDEYLQEMIYILSHAGSKSF